METWETLTMSRKDVPRDGLLKAALAGKIPNADGARALQLSVRQFQRLKRRFAAEGPAGLRHRLRDRPSPRRVAASVRARVGQLLQQAYAGFNDCHATEKLREVEGLRLSRSSVRRLRHALGLPAKRRRRGRVVRTRRTPEAQMGTLVQLDASAFAWLEARGPTTTPSAWAPA
jgi:transposase